MPKQRPLNFFANSLRSKLFDTEMIYKSLEGNNELLKIVAPFLEILEAAFIRTLLHLLLASEVILFEN